MLSFLKNALLSYLFSGKDSRVIHWIKNCIYQLSWIFWTFIWIQLKKIKSWRTTFISDNKAYLPKRWAEPLPPTLNGIPPPPGPQGALWGHRGIFRTSLMLGKTLLMWIHGGSGWMCVVNKCGLRCVGQPSSWVEEGKEDEHFINESETL